MTQKPRKDVAKAIDHEKRTGGPYSPKPPLSDKAKQKRSEGMKAFNRKTGKVTALANTQVKRRKPPA